ncbi:hypothetical protein NYO91_04020 [Arhodomonas aquaeolei]|uniref:hypothetical protein n=1 Tax=Arhodomonas aquaeolei TaxID=2369 RepID=UPI002169E065|nr:hypothetical protein [Arhodomonas aquaeolei]MCS4503242.1 hypothetical protein [Arhodomonas aquaeolei]
MNAENRKVPTPDNDLRTGTLMHQSLEMQAAARGAVTLYLISAALRALFRAARALRRRARRRGGGAAALPQRCRGTP